LTAYRALSYAITHFIYKEGQGVMGTVTVVPGCAAAYRSDVFAQLDWSSDTVVEDMDVTVQVYRKKLGKIKYVNSAVVHTQDPRTIRDYCKQAFRWHAGAWQVGLKYGMIGGIAKIDWEYKLLMLEGLIFATLLIMSPAWYMLSLRPKMLGFMFLMDLVFTTTLAAIVAVAQRRADVLLHSLTYPFLRFLDCAVFVYSFWKVVVCAQQVRSWHAVRRY